MFLCIYITPLTWIEYNTKAIFELSTSVSFS